MTSAVHTAIAVSLDRDAAAAYARQTAAEDRAEQRVDRLERRATGTPDEPAQSAREYSLTLARLAAIAPGSVKVH